MRPDLLGIGRYPRREVIKGEENDWSSDEDGLDGAGEESGDKIMC